MTLRVLIVDDSLTVRMDLAQAFSEAGFQTLPCATAAEARAALARGDVGLCVLDVVLPDGDGITLLGEIRNDPSTAALPVLVLSSEADVQHRVRGLRTGASEYVGKPYDRSYVVARAQELIGRHPRESDDVPKVVVIDDSPTFRHELCRVLEQAGYDVSQAASGEEGLKLLSARRPDGIIVDGVLPGMDGASVLRSVRLDAALRSTACILLTSSDDRDAELKALDAGADAFVRKNGDFSELLARLSAVLRRPREQGTNASLHGPKKVLAVDNDEAFREELSDALREEGFDVVMAKSGEEALELLALQPPDCVLLDLRMPGIGGIETCRRIKASTTLRDVPVMLLTAVEERSALLEALASGADDYVTKSTPLEVLKARVRAQLRRRQQEEESRRAREQQLQRELQAVEAKAARELAQTRAVLVQELERKNKELEAFVYSVSHDLRAPLRSIDGFTLALIEGYSEGLDERGSDYLRRARKAAQRMGELIDDLLYLSRVGRAELRRQRLDLSKLAAAITDELAAKEPGRTVEVAIQSGVEAHGDEGLVRIALENLLGNAWKFTAKRQQARVEFGVRPGDDGPVFFVSDNGAGFNMNYVGKMFRPFQRLHRDSDFPGTGIGLATVYRVVERHGGTVWAQASVGEGATFYFTLPPPRRIGE